jgi:hypothetical protein
MEVIKFMFQTANQIFGELGLQINKHDITGGLPCRQQSQKVFGEHCAKKFGPQLSSEKSQSSSWVL